MSRRAWLVVLAALLVLVGCSAPVTDRGTVSASATRVDTSGPQTEPGESLDADPDPGPGPIAGQATVRRLAIVPYTDPPRVTGSFDGLDCQASPDGIRPDPLCTPGAVGTVDKQEVCGGGFSRAHRPPSWNTAPAKTAAMAAYGIPPEERGTVELDHWIPLGAGGSNDRLNLFAARSDQPGKGTHNTKDETEAAVVYALCRPGSKLTLIAVQQAFDRDWRTVLVELRLPPLPR